MIQIMDSQLADNVRPAREHGNFYKQKMQLPINCNFNNIEQ